MSRVIHETPFVIKPDPALIQKYPELRRQSNLISRKYADNQVVTEEDLTVIGSNLWNVLNLQEKFDKAYQSASAEILPIIIESDIPEIQVLPWETLYHPAHGFIGKNNAFALSRRVKQLSKSSSNLRKGPLRVLLFTSLPDDVDPERGRLNVEEEQIQVQEALLPWIAKGLVQLEIPDDGRFSTLRELIKNFEPHILYLSGHGKFNHQPHLDEPAYGEFFFESEAGNAHAVKEDDIAKALIGSGIQVVVISACESGKAASDELNNGLTRKLSTQGIAHVIGMRESIYDKAGIQFARTLCDELAGQQRIDVALQSARIAIQKPFAENQVTRREITNIGVEELSLGQWCLPMLISSDVETPIADWDFLPQIVETKIIYRKQIDTVSLPARFVGRRSELRTYKNKLIKGDIQKLLLIAPGGQGKTSLAGKLALDLQKYGYKIFAWSAHPDNKNTWFDFEFEMASQLSAENIKKYDHLLERLEKRNLSARAKLLLSLLIEKYNGKVVLFLDNLETIQDKDSLKIIDPTVAAWMQTAETLPSLILLATSRWKPPTWEGEVLLLERANYGDFLQIAQALLKQSAFLQDRTRLRKIYDVLGGNSRGLEFFAAATSFMEDITEEEDLLLVLQNTKSDLQDNMAIEMIYQHLANAAKTLLSRLPAFYEPVPAEGILKLALDLPEPENLLQRLLNVSLIEAKHNPEWDVIEYQCVPLVNQWLRDKRLIDEVSIWLQTVADFHVYLHQQERKTVAQAMIAHHSLRRADRHDEADRLTLEWVVGSLTQAGFYRTLLDNWLPRICESKSLHTQAQALGQTGKLHLHLGDYETALTYLKQSLAICQQIGDKAGLCATLFNMGHIHAQNKQMAEAASAWVTVYLIAKQINLAQVLQALADLAPKVGLPEGLEGWEMLAQQMPKNKEE